MCGSEYEKLLYKIKMEGLNKTSVAEVLAIHNETGKKVIDLCGEPEKVALKMLIESYLRVRKQLKNALVLPAKVGDTVFEVGGQYTKNIVPWKIREIILHSNGVRFICDCEDGGDLHRCVDVYNNEMQTFWDKSPFCLTSAAAEKRLAELGGNKR